MVKGWLGYDNLVHWVIADYTTISSFPCVEIFCVEGYPTTQKERITSDATITCLICIAAMGEPPSF